MSASGDELVKISQLKELISQQSIPPVGAVYTSYTSTSPASIWGGSWTELKGVFPYYNHGVGTGGSNSHTLTVAQIPSHRHTLSNWHAVCQEPGNLTAHCISVNLDDRYPTDNKSLSTGGGGSHNNMPQYQTLYAWRRTA